MKKLVEVAAAVMRRADGRVLLGQRAADTFFGGYWEFPGGKVELNETPRQALMRELYEELGVRVEGALPWLVREHHYDHAHVRLHFFHIEAWEGEPEALVHSALSWQNPAAAEVAPMLPANGPIFKSLCLPTTMGVTHASQIGVAAQLKALSLALHGGLRLVRLREPALEAGARQTLLREATARCRAHGALLLASPGDAQAEAGVAGAHLTSAELMAARLRPDFEWVGASCHSRAELEHAAALGLDYALLGMVQPSPSHPGERGIGWAGLAELLSAMPIPVFAIGGMTQADLHTARAAGAHGIASIRAAWSE